MSGRWVPELPGLYLQSISEPPTEPHWTLGSRRWVGLHPLGPLAQLALPGPHSDLSYKVFINSNPPPPVA